MKTLHLFFLIFFLGSISCTHKIKVSEDNFSNMDNWQVEANDGGEAWVHDGYLELVIPGGASVWYKHKIKAPCKITYTAQVIEEGGINDRVSDLNCFVMAQDLRTQDLLQAHPPRTGNFKEYHEMYLYYVGYGGNENKTTRFRRYNGQFNRPLLPEHDLADLPLIGNHPYKVEIEVKDSSFIYRLDGKEIFCYKDTTPLIEGYFAFRTYKSHHRYSQFKVEEYKE